MKLAVASDLHLEFQDIDLYNEEGASVLILAGDIMISEDLHKTEEPPTVTSPYEPYKELGHRQLMAKRYRDFLQRCSERFPHVVYIAGNHEFYQGKWVRGIQTLRDECAKFPNVYFLERDTKVIDDVTFIGGTLWTDANNHDPLTLHALSGLMNDFKVIVNDQRGFTRLRPAHTVERHTETLGYFKTVLSNLKEQKVVVVGHHSPSHQSIHEMYANDTLMNGGYHSDLSEFILDHQQVKVWIHGHTHVPFDYMMGDTRIFCNPRGYSGWDPHADFFKLKYIEV